MNVCRCGVRVTIGFLCSFCSMEQVDWFKTDGEEVEQSAEELVAIERARIERAKKKAKKEAKGNGKTN